MTGNRADIRVWKSMRKNTNSYQVKEDTVIITTVKGETILASLQDIELIKGHCWHVDKKGYAMGGTKHKRFRLHNLIMNPPVGKVVDHINRNRLDNRRCNLRIVSNQENQRNRGLNKNNRSGTNGVYYNKDCKKWVAQITINGRTIYGGLHENMKEAIVKRRSLEEQYYKERSEHGRQA